MRLWFPLASLVFLAFAGGACNGTGSSSSPNKPSASSPAAQEDLGEILATVDGMPVGSNEFEKSAARKVPADGEALSLEEKQEVLDRLVADKLLYKKALAEGLDQDPKVQKVMVNTLLRQEVYSKVRNSDFDDEMLRAYFDSHPDEFIVPEKVQIKRILIRITDDRPDAAAKEEAQRIRKEVASDPKSRFKEVATKYSEDPYRRRGGDVGFVSKEGKPGLDQAIVDKAFGMATGEVSEVFKTSDGYNIVYVANRRDRVERSFQQMKGSVLRKVKNERLKELYDKYVAELRSGADIKTNIDKLTAIEIKPAAKGAAMPGISLTPAMPSTGTDGSTTTGSGVPKLPPRKGSE